MQHEVVAAVAYAFMRVEEETDLCDALPETFKRQQEKKRDDLERLYHAGQILRGLKQDVQAASGCYVTITTAAEKELKVYATETRDLLGVFPVSSAFNKTTLEHTVILVLEKHKEVEAMDDGWKKDNRICALMDTLATLRLLFDTERRL
jgi:hypothetical protein